LYAQASAYDVKPTTSYDEISLLAQITFAEGAGDYKSENAMEGISWVVRNRMEIGSKYDFPDRSSYATIIYQSGQFEAVGGDLWNKAANPASLTGPNAAAYDRALTVAKGVYNGTIPDPTKGAVFFHSGWPPPSGHQDMIDRKTIVDSPKQIGNHYFYGYR
jgi:spore germination cell wall hydrolase CwlJ-like protein